VKDFANLFVLEESYFIML